MVLTTRFSESTKSTCIDSGGSGGNGSISSSNFSILRRTLSIARPLFLPLFRFDDPQLHPPVRQRLAQSGDVGVAGEEFRFDGCDLATAAFYLATFHSHGNPHSLGFKLLERPAVAVQYGLLAGVFLITANDAVGVFRIKLHQASFAVPSLAGDQG
jgi:hypothetical protein